VGLEQIPWFCELLYYSSFMAVLSMIIMKNDVNSELFFMPKMKAFSVKKEMSQLLTHLSGKTINNTRKIRIKPIWEYYREHLPHNNSYPEDHHQ